jgi:uncharacterized cupredoxin-like copper-binding protein
MRLGVPKRMGIVVMLALAVAACGGDDGGSVRSVGSGSASGSGSGSGSASGSASGSGVAECVPVGDSAAADETVGVTLDEWSVTPDTESVAAGSVTFDVANDGEDAHELVIVRADDVASLPLNADDIVDEEALPEGAFIGEVEAFPAGDSCEGTFELEPASYALFCNIVEEEEGEIENHFQLGMSTEFTVE